MHKAWGIASIGAVACLIGSLAAAPVDAAPTLKRAADTITANYQMESDTATTMADTSGNNIDGTFGADPATAGLDTHVAIDAGFGYQWNAPPTGAAAPKPDRVVTVGDNANIEPGDLEFSVEVKFKTSADGTIAQKGQPTTAGGHWRVQIAAGLPACLFRGATAQGATKGSTVVTDNAWHVVRCELSGSNVRVNVDGTNEGTKVGAVGAVDNADPLTIGGKVDCTRASACDYYSGLVDYITIRQGGNVNNEAPVAKFTSDCTANDGSCSFTSTSTDNGSIDSFDWDFGDGTSHGTTANPNHAYADPGTYTVRLIVEDNDGATDSAAHTIDVLTGVPPSRPRQVTATAGLGTAKISWLRPSTPGGGTITSYTATSTPGGHTCTTPSEVELTCTMTLDAGTSYTFIVRANSTVGPGVKSQATAAVTPFGKPSAPGSPNAKGGNHQATVTWTAADGNGRTVTSYVVTRLPGGAKKTVNGQSRSVVFTKLKNGASYHFTVAAVNSAGRGPAATTDDVTPVGPPTKVTHVTAKAGKKSALIKWAAAKPNGSPILHYKVTSSDGQHKVVGATARQVKVKFLKSGKSYRFRVRAVNKVGDGPWSAWTKAVTVR